MELSFCSELWKISHINRLDVVSDPRLLSSAVLIVFLVDVPPAIELSSHLRANSSMLGCLGFTPTASDKAFGTALATKAKVCVVSHAHTRTRIHTNTISLSFIHTNLPTQSLASEETVITKCEIMFFFSFSLGLSLSVFHVDFVY